ncbi:hypothetical protein DFH08DRAFT_823911 [Mycena albidolilacea]|uniref:Uncharacterized protein n=1 Tax=Mycena albidolilacea TaxID=1033008 RepID=A0AAD6Z5V2_9AGAR|nr:hypothetical protein DFH08DRAFT_823911 [Mycena albidolilacea]
MNCFASTHYPLVADREQRSKRGENESGDEPQNFNLAADAPAVIRRPAHGATGGADVRLERGRRVGEEDFGWAAGRWRLEMTIKIGPPLEKQRCGSARCKSQVSRPLSRTPGKKGRVPLMQRGSCVDKKSCGGQRTAKWEGREVRQGDEVQNSRRRGTGCDTMSWTCARSADISLDSCGRDEAAKWVVPEPSRGSIEPTIELHEEIQDPCELPAREATPRDPRHQTRTFGCKEDPVSTKEL